MSNFRERELPPSDDEGEHYQPAQPSASPEPATPRPHRRGGPQGGHPAEHVEEGGNEVYDDNDHDLEGERGSSQETGTTRSSAYRAAVEVPLAAAAVAVAASCVRTLLKVWGVVGAPVTKVVKTKRTTTTTYRHETAPQGRVFLVHNILNRSLASVGLPSLEQLRESVTKMKPLPPTKVEVEWSEPKTIEVANSRDVLPTAVLVGLFSLGTVAVAARMLRQSPWRLDEEEELLMDDDEGLPLGSQEAPLPAAAAAAAIDRRANEEGGPLGASRVLGYSSRPPVPSASATPTQSPARQRLMTGSPEDGPQPAPSSAIPTITPLAIRGIQRGGTGGLPPSARGFRSAQVSARSLNSSRIPASDVDIRSTVSSEPTHGRRLEEGRTTPRTTHLRIIQEMSSSRRRRNRFAGSGAGMTPSSSAKKK